MKKTFIKILYSFIPSHKKRIKLLKQMENAERLKQIKQNNHIEFDEKDKSRIDLDINGTGNSIIIKKISPTTSGKINISLYGNNCEIFFEENIAISTSLNIVIGLNHPNFGKVENTSIHIGKHTTFEQCGITTYNSNASINIGEKCMFAYEINLFHTDAHPIYNMEKNKIINKVKTINIGNHVWVGAKSTILKNVTIPNDCIIGYGSIVTATKSIPPHSIIAGNPATIVKKDICWDANGSTGYIQNDLQ